MLPEPGDGGEALHAIAPRRRDIQLALEEVEGNPNGCQHQNASLRVFCFAHFAASVSDLMLLALVMESNVRTAVS